MSISGRLFPPPVARTSVTSPGNGIHRSNLGGCNCVPADFSAMAAENGTEALASGRHAYKSQTPAFITMAAPHHIRCLNAARRFENLPKGVDRDITRQATYVDIRSTPLSFALPTSVSRACETKRNGSRDGS